MSLSESNEQYDAMLVDIEDHSSAYGQTPIEAATDDEAKSCSFVGTRGERASEDQ